MGWTDYIPIIGPLLGGAGGLTGDQGQSKDNQNARAGLLQNASTQGGFGGAGYSNYNNDTAGMQSQIAALQALANGQNSVSAEQLRQGLQQNLAGQQSIAAGASPQNSVMAARTAAIQSGRLGAGLAGQQAVAGLQERQNAQQNLGQLLLGQRGQDVQAALGGFGASNQAYGNSISTTGDKSTLDKLSGLISAGASLGGLAASDRRLKTEIADGDDEADKVLDGLKAYSYKYKDSKYGEGKQLGVMAQDLERVVPDAVINTREGKMVNGAKLAGALAATLPGLNKRLRDLESKSN